MAYVKILGLTSVRHLSQAIDYIEDAEKTDQNELVYGYACEPSTAASDFLETRLMAARSARRPNPNKKNYVAYHIVQSFAPGEATPEQAHEIGKRLANEFLGGRFEYVLATHTDKGHVHNHIMVCAVSFYDHKKLYTRPYKTIAQLRDISDRLCVENDLSVIQRPGKLGYSYKEWSERRNGTSWKSEIRKRLNFILERVTSYEEFVDACVALNLYYNDRGKQTQFRLPGQERNVRGDTLDKKTGRYSAEGIRAKCQRNLERANGQPQKHDIRAEWENREKKSYSFDDIPVPVPQSMIVKAGEGGLLLRTNTGERLFLSNHLLDYDEEQERYVFHVQLRKNYALTPERPDPDVRLADQSAGRSVRGEDLLTQMAQANGVPVRVYLASVENLPAVQIQRRIIAIERSASRARVHQLNDVLWTLKHENIQSAGDFGTALDSLNKEAADVQKQTSAAENKRMEFVQVSKWLNTVQLLEDVHWEYARQLPWGRKRFLSEHQGELAAYDHAAGQLQALGISQFVDVDKVQAMVDQQDERIAALKQQERTLDLRIRKLKMAQEEVNGRDTSRAREEMEHNHREEYDQLY